MGSGRCARWRHAGTHNSCGGGVVGGGASAGGGRARSKRVTRRRADLHGCRPPAGCGPRMKCLHWSAPPPKQGHASRGLLGSLTGKQQGEEQRPAGALGRSHALQAPTFVKSRTSPCGWVGSRWGGRGEGAEAGDPEAGRSCGPGTAGTQDFEAPELACMLAPGWAWSHAHPRARSARRASDARGSRPGLGTVARPCPRAVGGQPRKTNNGCGPWHAQRSVSTAGTWPCGTAPLRVLCTPKSRPPPARNRACGHGWLQIALPEWTEARRLWWGMRDRRAQAPQARRAQPRNCPGRREGRGHSKTRGGEHSGTQTHARAARQALPSCS